MIHNQDYTSHVPLVTKDNIHKILEFINTTDDLETQASIFSILAVYIVSNNTNKDVIITCNKIYEKIRNILIQGNISRTMRTMNFVTALLYVDVEDNFSVKRSLVLHAQNMLRHTGCLLAMSNLFIKPMLHQETWGALCRCLTETCRSCKENQSFCSHLVPLCIQKCIQGDVDVLPTLANLLNNHERNLKLFMESDGITIFRRELLQYDECMQLLATLAQNLSPEPLTQLYKVISKDLQYFKALYGIDTQIGQWSQVILHHIHSRVQGLEKEENSTNKDIPTEKIPGNIERQQPHYDETAVLLNNILKEINHYNESNVRKPKAMVESRIGKFKNRSNANRSMLSYKDIWGRHNLTGTPIHNNSFNDQKCESSRNEMSFSFLLKQNYLQNVNTKKRLITPQRAHIDASVQTTKELKNDLPKTIFRKQVSKNESYKSLRKEVCTDYTQNTIRFKDENNTSEGLEITCNKTSSNTQKPYINSKDKHLNFSRTFDFKPTFVSTPKHIERAKRKIMNSTKFSQSSVLHYTTFKSMNRKHETRRVSRDYECRHSDKSRQSEVKHRTMSSRLFDVINESCTTLVKTVKNIFKAKDKKKMQKEIETESGDNNNSCSYSFTEYMKKRDAVLDDRSAVNRSQKAENCRTCNDTMLLKRKIIGDDYLRETVKKLKLGINLYGCDFKKISRTMWPREAYMTPELLYNLYRKVILK